MTDEDGIRLCCHLARGSGHPAPYLTGAEATRVVAKPRSAVSIDMG
jgi:hypothetical protein